MKLTSTILILSEQTDITTDIVCAWLNHSNCKYLRINDEDAHNPDVETRIIDGQFKVLYLHEGLKYDLSDIEICWCRRGFLNFHFEKKIPDVGDSTNESMAHFMDNEGKTLENFLYHLFGKKKSINHPAKYNFNKLIALYEAANLGFKIPNTLLCRSSTDLKKFMDENGNCISKSIQDIMPISYAESNLSIGKIMRVKKHELVHSNYWFSLFQKEIKKNTNFVCSIFLVKCMQWQFSRRWIYKVV